MATRRRIAHLDAPHIAMPLGGIGTGNVALAADGSLRQWQLHNTGNHLGTLPNSFFALHLTSGDPGVDRFRVLQGEPPAAAEPTPLVNDDHVPDWQRRNLERFGGFAEAEFGATYPVGEVRFSDPSVPLEIRMEAFTPLVPPDVDKSSLPVAMVTFTLRNRDTVGAHGILAAALQNAVGWDGMTPIDGVHAPGYGGNTNRVVREGGWTSVVMENASLAADDPSAGQLVLATAAQDAAAFPQWRDPGELAAFLASGARTGEGGRQSPRPATGASPAGQTWNGAVGVGFGLGPGEETTIRFVLAWHFPNRYVNFDQFVGGRPEHGRSRFWLGNAYTTRFADAHDVVRQVRDEWDELRAATLDWTSIFTGSSLDDAAVEHLAAQLTVIRSPTCFVAADGTFFGFEGVRGRSTAMWAGEFGGSCPLNCTHVWNYAQAMAATFPQLEQSMRRTEFEVMQAPEGYLPHRVVAPTYLKQFWDEPMGGPSTPALDGMLGSILKTYREYRHGAGEEWLTRYWPGVKALLAHIRTTWDRDDTGVLRGIQPSTHDIDLRGLNTFMGTYWLAALRAAATMADLQKDTDLAAELTAVFERGSTAYDEALFNGEYYVQKLEPDEPRRFQWEEGCLSDQLVGQWWAHELDLGYLLPPEHVRSALRAIVRHNFRDDFVGFAHTSRIFADGDDAGLLMCSWPLDGRPEVPTLYSDEVWTGCEYQVAAHCLREGLYDEGRRILDAVWARYDGRRRNPYNHIECGDHYARSMSGWSALGPLTGVAYDASERRLTVAEPARDPVGERPASAIWPIVTAEGWGVVELDGDAAPRLSCRSGRIVVRALRLGGATGDTEPDVELDVVVTAGESVALDAN